MNLASTHRAHLARFGTRVRILSAIGLLSATLSLHAQTGATTVPDAAKSGTSPTASRSEGAMDRSMMPMMQSMQSIPTSSDTDVDFAKMMRVHHEGAIDMAHAELKSGRDPKMRDMAKRIIAAQQMEIREFDQWLAKHKPD